MYKLFQQQLFKEGTTEIRHTGRSDKSFEFSSRRAENIACTVL